MTIISFFFSFSFFFWIDNSLASSKLDILSCAVLTNTSESIESAFRSITFKTCLINVLKHNEYSLSFIFGYRKITSLRVS